MRLAAYCRVSTDKAEQMDSLCHQKEFFTQYAVKNGHQLVHLYADEGISGTSLKKRDGFLQLMRDAERGQFDLVAVKDISRFARNTVDALQSIRKLRMLGVTTLFLTANMDSMGDSEFILTLFSAMAQEESNNLSKRVKWGKRINAEKGRVPQCVFGYDRVDNFTLIIQPEEADTVRRIFELYTGNGLGCRSISVQLNLEGRFTKFGNAWDARGVRRILMNPIYCGILVNHKYEIVDFLTGRQVALPEEERFYHQRPQWAVVSLEKFQDAQRIMASRQRNCCSVEERFAGRHSAKHLFSTMIRCGCCGRSFGRKTYTYTNTRVYWRCTTNDRYTAQRCDNRICLEEWQLREVIRTYLHEKVKDAELIMANVESKLRGKSETKTWEKQEQLLKMKRERYRQLFINGLSTMEQLKENLSLLEEEENRMTAQRDKGKENQECRKIMTGFLNMESVTNMQLRQLVDHILVNEDGQVRVVFRNLQEENTDMAVWCSR